jgi:hypothetical protein
MSGKCPATVHDCRFDVHREHSVSLASVMGPVSCHQKGTPETSPWLAHVAARVTNGVRWSRVHILDHPLSDYCRYEIWGYAANQAAGEQIYLADRGAHPDLKSLREDFWLVDDAMVVRMIYDPQGRFERPELVEDVRPYIVMRDAAFRHAEPLDEYVARHGLEFTARSV